MIVLLGGCFATVASLADSLLVFFLHGGCFAVVVGLLCGSFAIGL
jgi:hypothetical protein